MSKNFIVGATVFVIATFGAASAQAFTICLKWRNFCDGLIVTDVGLGGAVWYHWDCASNSSLDVSKAIRPPYPSECGTNVGNRIVRSLHNGPGDFYFLIDLPFDGTLDLIQGPIPPLNQGTCFVENLAYDLQMGGCTGVGPRQDRSTIQ